MYDALQKRIEILLEKTPYDTDISDEDEQTTTNFTLLNNLHKANTA